MKDVKELWINLLITIIILVAIAYFFNLEEIYNVIVEADYTLLIAAIGAYIIVNLIMSYRIWFILKKLKHKSDGILSILETNLAGMLASDFTPARSGYFFTAFSLSSKFKIPINDSLLTIVGPQLFDFTIKAVSLSIMAVLITSSFDGFGDNIVITVLGILGVFLVIGFFASLIFVNGFLKRVGFIKKLPLGKKVYGLFNLMQNRSQDLIAIKWEIILITLASWNSKAFEWFLLSKALGINIIDGGIMDYLFMLIFQGSVTLIHFIPLPTLAGSGASEVGFAGILFLFGVDLEVGIAFALLTRFVMIAIDIFGIKEILRYAKKEGINGIIREIDSIEHH